MTMAAGTEARYTSYLSCYKYLEVNPQTQSKPNPFCTSDRPEKGINFVYEWVSQCEPSDWYTNSGAVWWISYN